MRTVKTKSILRVLALLCLAALALALSAGTLPAAAGEATRYIVKYRENFAWLLDRESAMPFGLVDGTELELLLRADALEWYEEDAPAVLLDELPADEELSPYYEKEKWDLAMIGADLAYQMNCTGRGVRVGVIDSGVAAHSDLAGRLKAGWNFQDASSAAGDSLGHGTFVAGLVAGFSDLNGMIGAAPGADIVPLKITNSNGFSASDIIPAIYEGIERFHCQVLNLSLGTESDLESMREAVAYAEEHGVTLVAAAGNSGNDTLYYPAAYDTVIGVGAVTKLETVYDRSSRHAGVFLTAPGVAVRSLDFQGGYRDGTGTSFATPLVSGAAAVLLGMDGDLTPAQLRDILAQSAADKGEPGYDTAYGYGVLHVGGSIDALFGGGSCYIADDRGGSTRIFNRTGEEMDCFCLLAEYSEDGALLGLRQETLHIRPYDSASVEAPEQSGYFARFLCDAGTLEPLAGERKTEILKTED
ncbi:MAG: S8 family serine peptidase [Oscillospiraceae bacterium]|nr:S8 family serine peptidase [Oscillospiraceae bacterium]